MAMKQEQTMDQEVNIVTLRDLIVAGFQAQGRLRELVNERFEQIDGRFNDLESRLSNVENRLDKIDGKVDEILKRLDRNT